MRTKHFALVSGGSDSMLLLRHLRENNYPLDGVLFLDTGIALSPFEIKDFLMESAKKHETKLFIASAQAYLNKNGDLAPQIYEQMIKEYGFFGPWMHKKAYARLKERPLIQFKRTLKSHGYNCVFYSGTRKHESFKRFQVVKPTQKWGSSTFISPLHDLTNESKAEKLKYWNIKISPVAQTLKDKNIGVSGDCGCGAYAKKGELQAIYDAGFTGFVDYIHNLEKRVSFPWGWEDSPPKWWGEKQRGQEFLSSDFEAILCSGCALKGKVA